MCEKTIKLSLEQARKMYKKSPEMDELLLANFSKKELEKPEFPKKWNDLEKVDGYFIGQHGAIVKSHTNWEINSGTARTIFATEKQAKSALAMAQLSQLMKVYNGDWEQPSPQITIDRFVLVLESGKIRSYVFNNSYHFLTFKTDELRNKFLKNFEPLIKEYFMID